MIFTLNYRQISRPTPSISSDIQILYRVLEKQTVHNNT